jgi:hypothetical protein
MALMVFSGAWRKLIYKKPEVKISWHCPFNNTAVVLHEECIGYNNRIQDLLKIK